MRSVAPLLVSMWLAFAGAELSAQSRNAPRAIAAGQSLWMEELTWMEVRDLVDAGWTTVIIGTGGWSTTARTSSAASTTTCFRP